MYLIYHKRRLGGRGFLLLVLSITETEWIWKRARNISPQILDLVTIV